MNILQLISSGEGFYGAERVVTTLSAELAATEAHVVVGAFVNAAKTRHVEVLDVARDSGLTTSEIHCRGRFDHDAVLTIRNLVRQHDIDIIHSHGAKANLYAYLAATRRAPRLVSTCHSWYHNTAIERLISWSDRVVLGGFDAVVVVSDSIRLPLRYSLVPAGRIVTVHNGIACQSVTSPGPVVSSEFRLGTGAVVGTAARLSPEKGLRSLIHAAASVLPEFKDTMFVIAGDGVEREPLRELARELGILTNVTFLGNRSDMPGFYASIDLFVLPSLTEGLPMALIEAMAAGKAVVASAVGSVPVVVQDRDNGVLVRPGDVAGLATALRELLRDAGLRTTLGRSARDTVESEFSAPAMTRQYLRVYESVLASGKDQLPVEAGCA